MSNLSEKLIIRCDNDCQMSGCPTHEFELHFQSTSDWFSISKDGEHEWGADLNEMQALLTCLQKMAEYRVEVAGIMSRATPQSGSAGGGK